MCPFLILEYILSIKLSKMLCLMMHFSDNKSHYLKYEVPPAAPN